MRKRGYSPRYDAHSTKVRASSYSISSASARRPVHIRVHQQEGQCTYMHVSSMYVSSRPSMSRQFPLIFLRGRNKLANRPPTPRVLLFSHTHRKRAGAALIIGSIKRNKPRAPLLASLIAQLLSPTRNVGILSGDASPFMRHVPPIWCSLDLLQEPSPEGMEAWRRHGATPPASPKSRTSTASRSGAAAAKSPFCFAGGSQHITKQAPRPPQTLS
jgi:hypothetical protein